MTSSTASLVLDLGCLRSKGWEQQPWQTIYALPPDEFLYTQLEDVSVRP